MSSSVDLKLLNHFSVENLASFFFIELLDLQLDMILLPQLDAFSSKTVEQNITPGLYYSKV